MTKVKEGLKNEYVLRSVNTMGDDVTRTDSHASHLSKPEQDENENKAQYAWRLIRHSVRNAIDVVNKADTKDMVISHGVHQNRRLNHTNPVNQILYNGKTKVT